jgi:hypothetical protein
MAEICQAVFNRRSEARFGPRPKRVRDVCPVCKSSGGQLDAIIVVQLDAITRSGERVALHRDCATRFRAECRRRGITVW